MNSKKCLFLTVPLIILAIFFVVLGWQTSEYKIVILSAIDLILLVILSINFIKAKN